MNTPRDIERELSGDPTNVDLHTYRAAAFMILTRWEAAIVQCDVILALDRNSAYAYATRAMARACQDDFTNARADIERSLAIDPTFDTALGHCQDIERL